MGSAGKRHRCIKFLWLLVLIGEPCFASSISPATDYTINQTPVYEGSSEITLPLNLDSSVECDHLRAVLVQRATALAAVLDERTIDDCAPSDGNDTSFSFTVPNVARVTNFAWEFQSCHPKQDCISIGEVNFVALPEDYLQPLINWSQEHTVFVSDADGWLVMFLDRLGVQYTHNTREIAADNDVVVLVNVAQSTDTNRTKGIAIGHRKRIIEFHDYPSEQPMVWVDSSAEGVVIEVRFPLIHTIERDAANKKIFYELFQRLFLNLERS